MRLDKRTIRTLLASPINLFFLLTLVGFALTLAWVMNIRFTQYKEHQQDIAQRATTTAANEIASSIASTRKYLKIFVNDNPDLLSALQAEPNNKSLISRVKANLGRYFPDLFAISLATSDGRPLIDDFEGNVGEICIADMKETARTGVSLIRVHPNQNRYHIDIMQPFDIQTKKYIFLASFSLEKFSNVLRILSPAGHQMLVIQPDRNRIIEITEHGGRDRIKDRLDFSLTQSEESRILATRSIPGTSWSVIDLHDVDLFRQYKQNLRPQIIKIYFVFLAFTVYMWQLILQKEWQQKITEQKLLSTNQEVVSLNKKLEDLAVTDELTGLYNRRYLNDRLQSEWNRATRSGHSLAIALIDIDYFKQYNDVYGHQAGDACLREVAGILGACLRRANEIVARYGGEEFLAIFADTRFDEVTSRIQSLQNAIASKRIEHKKSSISDFLTLSIGVAIGTPEPTGTVKEFISAADEALYQAKSEGRNRVIIMQLS